MHAGLEAQKITRKQACFHVRKLHRNAFSLYFVFANYLWKIIFYTTSHLSMTAMVLVAQELVCLAIESDYLMFRLLLEHFRLCLD